MVDVSTHNRVKELGNFLRRKNNSETKLIEENILIEGTTINERGKNLNKGKFNCSYVDDYVKMLSRGG